MASPDLHVRRILAVTRDARVVAAQPAAPGAGEVILKVPASEAGAAAVRREAEILALAEAPHFLGVSDGPSGMAIAMSHAGGTLHDRAMRADGAAIGCDEANAWLRGGVRALCRLHERGIAHGDVCPANLTMDAAGRVHAIDLGLASLLLPPVEGRPGARPARDWALHVAASRLDSVKGRPCFISPNVHDGLLGTRRDDLISLWLSVAWAMTARGPPAARLAWTRLCPEEGEPKAAFFKRIGRAMRATLDDPRWRQPALFALPPRARYAFDALYNLGFSERPPYDALMADL